MWTILRTATVSIRSGRLLSPQRHSWRAAAFILTLIVLPFAAQADSAESPNGGLFFKTNKPGVYYEAPLVKTEAQIAVTGTIVRATVRQHFVNPSSAWLEGVYVFPLPERSAVDKLSMEIGDRRVTGEIKEKQEAKRIYETAAASGQHASLVSSQRPNIFTTAVANIGPGEQVVVEIQYQDKVTVEDGVYGLRFPMVVGPRYIPGGIVAVAATTGVEGTETAPPPNGATNSGGGWAMDTDRVPDASQITPPVIQPGQGKINPVTITVDLDAGFATDRVISLYHPIVNTDAGDGRRIITLASADVPADRDFVLEWFPAKSQEPSARVFAEERGGDVYLSAMLTPVDAIAPGERQPRDVIFVVDTSGSMEGASIQQAKAALSLALNRLTPVDKFNIIQFNSFTNALYGEPKPWTTDSLAEAQAYVAGLRAENGTEMQPALRQALAGASEPGRLKQVVFMTDAAVGNEAALFDDIAARLGSARLFTIGIGAAPNSYFMRKAAELGRGSFTYIGSVTEVSDKMGALLRKLEEPALTNIAVAWPEKLADKAEMYPATVPDLYRGQPVTFTARLPGVSLQDLAGDLAIEGHQGDTTWKSAIGLNLSHAGAGIAAVWARAKLDAIEDQQWRGVDAASVRKQATQHALAYELVSAYTSLVAVDEPVTRPPDQPQQTVQVPTNLPHGWNYEKVFGPTGEAGKDGNGTAPGSLMREINFTGTPLDSLSMPQTATPAMLHLLIGLALLSIAALAWRFGRPRSELA
jgi:Ca-activated chloride channel homolog